MRLEQRPRIFRASDPATTPLKPARQSLFGFCVAVVYGTLQMLHLVFGLFFALLIVCAIRGLSLHVWALWRKTQGGSAGGTIQAGVGRDAAATA